MIGCRMVALSVTARSRKLEQGTMELPSVYVAANFTFIIDEEKEARRCNHFSPLAVVRRVISPLGDATLFLFFCPKDQNPFLISKPTWIFFWVWSSARFGEISPRICNIVVCLCCLFFFVLYLFFTFLLPSIFCLASLLLSFYTDVSFFYLFFEILLFVICVSFVFSFVSVFDVRFFLILKCKKEKIMFFLLYVMNWGEWSHQLHHFIWPILILFLSSLLSLLMVELGSLFSQISWGVALVIDWRVYATVHADRYCIRIPEGDHTFFFGSRFNWVKLGGEPAFV